MKQEDQEHENVVKISQIWVIFDTGTWKLRLILFEKQLLHHAVFNFDVSFVCLCNFIQRLMLLGDVPNAPRGENGFLTLYKSDQRIGMYMCVRESCCLAS